MQKRAFRESIVNSRDSDTLFIYWLKLLISSESNWLLLCKLRVMVDSLTLTCHLFSIQLTYSARDFLLSRAYRQSSYFCESVKVTFWRHDELLIITDFY